MNIVVLIKQVPDTGVQLKFSKETLDETGLRFVICPYDEFALEAALKLKPSLGGKVFALSVGPERVKEALLTSLALGADEAFHLKTNQTLYDSLSVASSIKEALQKIPSLSLVLSGKIATDTNNGCVPQMLAYLLDFPFVTNINSLEYKDKVFTLARECVGNGQETLRAPLPLVLSVDKGLNQPRYPSLAGIMKAKKKPLHSCPLTEVQESLELVSLVPPPEKKDPQILTGDPDEQVKTLISALKEKEKLL